jgi:hypothetical protein
MLYYIHIFLRFMEQME